MTITPLCETSSIRPIEATDHLAVEVFMRHGEWHRANVLIKDVDDGSWCILESFDSPEKLAAYKHWLLT